MKSGVLPSCIIRETLSTLHREWRKLAMYDQTHQELLTLRQVLKSAQFSSSISTTAENPLLEAQKSAVLSFWRTKHHWRMGVSFHRPIFLFSYNNYYNNQIYGAGRHHTVVFSGGSRNLERGVQGSGRSPKSRRRRSSAKDNTCRRAA